MKKAKASQSSSMLCEKPILGLLNKSLNWWFEEDEAAFLSLQTKTISAVSALLLVGL
jgi:hypothetical protein